MKGMISWEKVPKLVKYIIYTKSQLFKRNWQNHEWKPPFTVITTKQPAQIFLKLLPISGSLTKNASNFQNLWFLLLKIFFILKLWGVCPHVGRCMWLQVPWRPEVLESQVVLSCVTQGPETKSGSYGRTASAPNCITF